MAAGICGCGNTSQEAISCSDCETMTFRAGQPVSYSIYETPKQDGFDYFPFAADEKSVYYSKIEPVDMGVDALSSQVVAIDRDTGVETVIVDVLNNTSHWVNEHILTNHGIFWCLSKDDSAEIQMYDFETKEIKTIKQYDDISNTVSLFGNEDYITWIEWDHIPSSKDDGTLEGTVYAYDCKDDSVIKIDDGVYSSSAYARIYSSGDKCVYAKYDKGKMFICIYDMDSEKLTGTFECDIETPSNIMLSEGYIVFTDAPNGAEPLNIYAYSLGENKTFLIWSDEEERPFSEHLVGDILLINPSYDGDESLICYDLSDKSVYSLEETGYYLWGYMSPGGYIVTEDSDSQRIFVFDFS